MGTSVIIIKATSLGSLTQTQRNLNDNKVLMRPVCLADSMRDWLRHGSDQLISMAEVGAMHGGHGKSGCDMMSLAQAPH